MHADTKAWEVDTLRGHVNNVSSVLFHARQVCLIIVWSRFEGSGSLRSVADQVSIVVTQASWDNGACS